MLSLSVSGCELVSSGPRLWWIPRLSIPGASMLLYFLELMSAGFPRLKNYVCILSGSLCWWPLPNWETQCASSWSNRESSMFVRFSCYSLFFFFFFGLITCTDPSIPPTSPIGVPLPPFMNCCYRRCCYCNRKYWCCWNMRGYSSCCTIWGRAPICENPSCPGISLSQLNLRIYDFDYFYSLFMANTSGKDWLGLAPELFRIWFPFSIGDT